MVRLMRYFFLLAVCFSIVIFAGAVRAETSDDSDKTPPHESKNTAQPESSHSAELAPRPKIIKSTPPRVPKPEACKKINKLISDAILSDYPLGFAEANGIEVERMRFRLVVQTFRWKPIAFPSYVEVEWGVGSTYQVLIKPRDVCSLAAFDAVMRIRRPSRSSKRDSKGFVDETDTRDYQPKKRYRSRFKKQPPRTR